jgi:DnaK suppressor protein
VGISAIFTINETLPGGYTSNHMIKLPGAAQAAGAARRSDMKPEERYRVLLQNLLAEYTPSELDKEALVITQQADELDTIQSTENRNMAVGRLSAHARRRQEIKLALRRLDEGEYGLCVDCEEPIKAKRLEAVPWAERCVICQEAHENEESHNPSEGAVEADEEIPAAKSWRRAA